MPKDVEQDWETHYTGMKGTVYEKAVMWYRKNIIAPSHQKIFKKVFSDTEGLYVEVGCGTAQASQLIDKGRKTLIAFDISSDALIQSKHIPQFDARIKGDAYHLPFKDESIDGIWNHGLYEHFTEEEIHALFSEVRRVLKPGARFYTFWPPMYSFNGTILRTIGLVARLVGKKIDFYPGEITRPWTYKDLKTLVSPHFSSVQVSFPARNMWGDFVVQAVK
jgi:SAM-dependent methyltransferase